MRDEDHQTVIDLILPQDRQEGLYPVWSFKTVIRKDWSLSPIMVRSATRMLHPSHHVDKIYQVEVNGFLADDAPAFFASGIALFGRNTVSASRNDDMAASLWTIAERSSSWLKANFTRLRRCF